MTPEMAFKVRINYPAVAGRPCTSARLAYSGWEGPQMASAIDPSESGQSRSKMLLHFNFEPKILLFCYVYFEFIGFWSSFCPVVLI